MFEPRIYKERRKRLLRAVGSGLGLFLGNEESPMNYPDNTFRFRQDSTFLYYFGLDRPGLAAVMDFDEGTATVCGDDYTVDDIVWRGPQPAIREMSRRAGVDRTGTADELAGRLKDARRAGRRIHFLPPYRAENALKLKRWLGLNPDRAAAAASVDLIRAVVEQRAVKGPEEIAELDRAADISTDMHVAAMRMVRPGIAEAEIAAEVHRVALAAGGDISFPIIASVRGETLHNHDHGNRLKRGDLFLLDAGAETALHYAGDLSSTVPASGTFTGRQREIYDITLAAHEAAAGALRPGVNHLDVHLLACRTIAWGLKEAGLMKGDPEDAVQAGAHALFFPCGVGHMMGLDVHDMEDLGEVYVGYEGRPKYTQFGLKSLRLARPHKPGFVVTIEPGIYFIPQLIDQWRAEGKFTDFIVYDKVEKYRTFGGIRNEEDFVITPRGSRRLGKAKPKTTAEVEAVLAAARK
ncbi:MAG TPA: aminopeptidase P family protein [Candidatus Aminicenantes bacterium]|nr:aminopeptidase P family protein [Candidatus Aminicenantes bacterium]